ncbi:hypothetical protein Rleg4DRAFT_2481 [Rhizobium leguminosarum bv. trifolii WSM2297]|uniref:ORC1/DEAH AAA+ ATPase domain-containing protein n=1 Tax=Rhizobium leguminosarum bv. trifolii WSM2297 TaxID=754762 RepID=J0CCD5_RHILT|nr:ATP-binding protein [Rhizobium leguminosarum]EJC80817.1 hypothetical protein Rleg4DRAFT_2481 [Rhizobium leguminosarum bv. trifolii WSM2297]
MADIISTDRSRLRALKNQVRRKRHKNERDDDLAEEIQAMLDNVEDFLEFGTCDERRGLFVTGPAGTGKSSALRHILSSHPELQPYRDEYGALIRPCLSIKLPKESKTNVVVEQVIKALDLPDEGSEKLLTPIMHDMLKAHKVRLLHFDEAQHTVRSQTSSAFEAVQDLVKQLIDREDWPVQVILSGMPRIEKMREDEQIGRRSYVFPFRRLDFEADKAIFSDLLIEIAGDCGITVQPKMLEVESLARLCKATHGAWGILICDIRKACFRALSKGKSEVTINNFAQEYERNTGALQKENIFTAGNWQELKVKETLKEMREEEE